MPDEQGQEQLAADDEPQLGEKDELKDLDAPEERSEQTKAGVRITYTGCINHNQSVVAA